MAKMRIVLPLDTKLRNLSAVNCRNRFIGKCCSLLDILFVRHCCFIIGPPGSSKTSVWKSLLQTLKSMGQQGKYETLNPKAITSDELYGIMTKTKEWRDGAIAVVMRNMSKILPPYTEKDVHKWVILDGDIDAEWIESMNTVMDDNKILTLVSNERIPFTPTMRMSRRALALTVTAQVSRYRNHVNFGC